MPAMADWRQIQARIRKAKNSVDAKTKLSELYRRTHDAMVAWELGFVEEKAERNDEAVKWYTIAAERFRRADWRKKAEEALTRLGAPLPVPGAKPSPEPSFAPSNVPKPEPTETATEPTSTAGSQMAKSEPHLAQGEMAEEPGAEGTEEEETQPGTTLSPEPKSQTGAESQDSADSTGKKKRRRGRRGGRGRRRKGAPAPALPAKSFASTGGTSTQVSPAPQLRSQIPKAAEQIEPMREEFTESVSAASKPSHEAELSARSERPAPMLPSERTAHGRAGDPALASRMSKLESMLRRLVSSPLHRLDEADAAPAGPGVFLLSDSDQITSYYVEACQTLRVGLGNLARGSGRSTTKPTRGGRPAFDSGLKTKLAEHLGIGEAKVSQYLAEHCVVRWIQLDDDAPHLAHFAIGVLRTPLNLD
ncbi:MAG: hypothetical protein WCA38_02200 [Candidatus Acidiferrales bacterium]